MPKTKLVWIRARINGVWKAKGIMWRAAEFIKGVEHV